MHNKHTMRYVKFHAEILFSLKIIQVSLKWSKSVNLKMSFPNESYLPYFFERATGNLAIGIFSTAKSK